MSITKFLSILVFITVLLPGSSIAELTFEGVAIVPAENQHIEFQEPVDPGKGWLALTAKNSFWELVPAHLHSKKIIVRNLGEIEDMELISDQPNALFLLRHPTLRAGKVETPELKFKDHPRRPRDGLVDIPWRGKAYRFIEKGLDVVLIANGRKTKLGRLKQENDDEYYSSLLWAGDLDRDDKLDVIVQYSSYESGATCLYLSSVASQGNLVKKISCWYSGG